MKNGYCKEYEAHGFQKTRQTKLKLIHCGMWNARVVGRLASCPTTL